MSEKLVPAVKALIERDGKLLVLKTEASGETYYVLPGGKIEYGESSEEALQREIKEELSCSIEIGDSVGNYHFFTGPEGDGRQVVLTVFRGSIGDQDIDISGNPADEGIIEYLWMRPEELIEESSNDSLKELIRNYSD
ncbi:NUDIX domain-containing protein [Candidatus Nanosalina sp. VS9-1]|uniref:NUDIX domain-containing protein n=1 Tax=Candidatus Nanosalina sp. VS9-1 TaxID=3388566 RepID=UPI0039DFAF11